MENRIKMENECRELNPELDDAKIPEWMCPEWKKQQEEEKLKRRKEAEAETMKKAEM